MRLTRYTDLSLRVLFFAGLKHPELSSIPEIAQTYLVPESHLTKVVHELGRAGYLETVRGRGGGLRLAKPLDQINLGEVVRLTESDFKLVECMAPASGNCCLEPSCTLTPVFEKAFLPWVAATTVNLQNYGVANQELGTILAGMFGMGGKFGPLRSFPLIARPDRMPPVIYVRYETGALAYASDADPTAADGATIPMV